MFKKTVIFITLIGLSMTLCGCVALLAGAIGGAGTAALAFGKADPGIQCPVRAGDKSDPRWPGSAETPCYQRNNDQRGDPDHK